MKIRKVTLALFASISMITSCQSVSQNTLQQSSTNNTKSSIETITTIKGKAEFPNSPLLLPSLGKRGDGGAFTVQATLGEVAPSATVSVLYPSDHATNPNVTIATGLTNATGNFTINPGTTFNPAVNGIYVLEAIKRIGGNGHDNITIRTYIRWNGTGWESMTTPGIYINTKTTALAIIQDNMKAQVSASETIGKIDVSSGNSVPLNIGELPVLIESQSVNDVAILVTQVLKYNYDPMHYIKLINSKYQIVVEYPSINPIIPATPNTTNITDVAFTANWAYIPDCTYDLVVTRVSDSTEVFNQNIGTVTSYTVTGLSTETEYTWKVRGKNTINNLNGDYTSELTVGTLLLKPVATSETNSSPLSFTANWNTVPNATGYKLFVDGLQYPDDSTVINTNTYDVLEIPYNSPHNYYVVAINSRGGSPNSNTISLVSPNPVTTSATNGTMSSFTANWDIVPNATGYKLFVDGSQYPDDSTVINTNTYDVTGLPRFFLGYYYVVAVNSRGKSSNSNITSYSNAVVSTFAGGTAYGTADGIGTNARFSFPNGITIDSSGNFYVSDNYRSIRKIDPAGVVTTLATNFAQGTLIYTPAVDSSGNVYVSDNQYGCIKKIDSAGVATTFAGICALGGGYADGTGTNARFSFPYGLAIDSSDNVYVAESHKIRKMTSAGVVTTLAGGSTSGYADGTGTNAKFNTPKALAVDSSGNIYVADSSNHKIRKITSSGVVTTLAGSTSGYADGIGTNAQFNAPMGVTVDSSENVYVTEAQNHRIRKITPAGVVTTVAGSTYGYADGMGTNAKFYSPMGITIDSSGNIYVTDYSNNRIRKLD